MGAMPITENESDLVEQRPGRERDNGNMLVALIAWFYQRRKELGIEVFPSQDLQVSPARRITADVCVTIGVPDEQVFIAPPFLCVEIHSVFVPMASQLRRIADYLNFGVRHVWHIDPHWRTAAAYTSSAAIWPEDGILRTANPDIALPLDELF
jgi:Uma2 family endonuclease